MQIHPQRFIILLISLTLLIQTSADEALDATRNIVKEWVATENAISSEAAQWQEKQELLQDLLSVTQTEIETLEESVREIEDTATEADAKRAELINQQESLSEGRQRISQFLAEIEPQLIQLRPTLPTPLAEKLANTYQRLPKDPSDTSLGIAERMQAIVTILSTVNKFDQTITVYEELRTLEDGRTSEVETVYIGLGAAYYRTRSGDEAGYGQPGPDGWTWHSQPELAADIDEVLDIANNRTQEARFIALPVELKN